MGAGGGVVVVVEDLVMKVVFDGEGSCPSQPPARTVLRSTWSANFQFSAGQEETRTGHTSQRRVLLQFGASF